VTSLGRLRCNAGVSPAVARASCPRHFAGAGRSRDSGRDARATPIFSGLSDEELDFLIQLTLKVLRVVGARLRRLVGIIEELSFATVRQRLVALVVRLAEASGTPSQDGLRFELTKSHQDLAAELGTVRELVSRN